MSHIAPCYPYRDRGDGESEAEYGLRVANELETEIQRLGPGNVAAFVAEPVVGATLGSQPAVPGYFQRIRQICDAHGVLLIADEVMSGIFMELKILDTLNENLRILFFEIVQ